MTDKLAAVIAYRNAPMGERCQMIRDHLSAQEDARRLRRIADYDRRFGAGAWERDSAEVQAWEAPAQLSAAIGYAPGDDRAIRQG